MIAIANVSKNNAIGKHGDLLCRIPDDLRRFRMLTDEKVVIMGHNTLKSLPYGLPLRDRINIVLTSPESKVDPGVVEHARVCGTPLFIVHSVEQALDRAKALSALSCWLEQDVFVIGGASVYRQFLPYCDTVMLTRNSVEDDEADAFFPVLNDEWRVKYISETYMHNEIEYTYETLERIKA